MKIEVKVPVLAESVAEATLGTWAKKQGDSVKKGENLIDIETDKVVLEVTAPDDGVLEEVRRGDGSEVKSDEIIALIDTTATASASTHETDSTAAIAPGPAPASRPPAEPVKATSSSTAKTSPAVRKLLEENNLSREDVKASGTGGRIVKADVQAHLKKEARQPDAVAPVVNQADDTDKSNRVEKRVPMTKLRKRIAERLMAAQQQNAILTTFNDVNMQPVMDLRARYKDKFENTYQVKLGFMSFFALASVEALKRFPVINASVDEDDIVYHGYFDIGIAVSSPRGLVVPILRNVESLSVAQIESQIAEFANNAKENKLSLDDLMGGTFTITNGGTFGSLLSTPILNPPQSAILGMHRIEKRPVAIGDRVEIRPMMYLALSYDHRIIDGKEAVQFLVTVKEMIEDPSRLLLQV